MNIEEKLTPEFCKMIDDIVLYASWADNELADAIKWLDKIARKENISLYQKVYEALYKHDIKKKAEKWWLSKN